MVHQVTQSLGMASLSHPSDPLEYAAQGHGMLTYPVRGPELDGEDFRQFWNAAHKNKNCTGGLPLSLVGCSLPDRLMLA